MIYKYRSASLLLSGLRALERRLPRQHEKYPYIAEELYNTQAGYYGELEYDRYMKEVRTAHPHAILHDLYLHHDGIHFQIDSLYISPESITISEIKNRADQIKVTAKPTQFLQVDKQGSTKIIRSPIAEIERKKQFLEKWLHQRNFQIPVTGIVVFAYNNQMIIEGEPSLPIMSSYDAPTYFRAQIIENYLLTGAEIQKLANALIGAHREFNPFPLLSYYKIAPDNLKNGVFCSDCKQPCVMMWMNRRWQCRSCGKRESSSHLAAIDEWFMLMPGKLTNKAFSKFAGIPNRHTAKRMLAQSMLRHQGIGRGSRYEPL
ncbi:nuclease-related domain-containing protein [Sporosarcina trichiuri]|uniref:nuclease-related domain-containing protein n=1 Tax=Sporosarcina trichiuri TaxID=3056445 RepID=UPI0025B2F480|nr:nuclease-related domain-containing protein [Sporosarcina sp. 0.2-SM1T-5]WJY26470.1 nuclease-related domain-containing protein [Sporosarcina sp. 0.2-SM1T-5]